MRIERLSFHKPLIAGCITLCVSLCAVASQAPEPQIWPRIVSGLRLVNNEQRDTIEWARYYARHPDAFEQMLERSRPYLWHIVEAVERRQMPLEIALLPAVESGFDPKARSQQKAQGLWQFVPQTGAARGLQNTRDYDARKDPIASTHAALGYLQDLSERFDDWLLALAAYNIGAGRLAATLRKQHDAREFWDLDLPRETREHVRRLMGLCLLIEQPKRFGIRLPDIPDRPLTQLVQLRHPVNLDAALKDAGVLAGVVQAYNPGLRNLTNTTSKQSVILPDAEAGRLSAALASGTFAPVPIPTVVVHVVKQGDSLWKIARKYDVHVRDLVRWNGLGDKALIRPGKRLEVHLKS